MKISPLIGVSGLVLQSALLAAPVPLVVSPGGVFVVNYQLSTGQSTGPKNIQITGDFSGDVQFTNGVISKFTFLGGNVAYSDTTAEVSVSTFPIVAKVRIEARNIVSALTSNSSAGAINATSGELTNSGHFLLQNRGTIDTRYIVAGITVDQEVRDLATRPDNNPLVGVTTVTSTLLQDLLYKARYRIDFSHTRNESRTQPAEVVNGTLNITEVGQFSATGEVTVPGQAFATWATTERGQTPFSLADIHTATGQPLVMLYAFNATSGPWTPPISFNATTNSIRLDLPPTGLNAPVKLEYSPTLAQGQWQTLMRNSTTPSVFTPGESGPITMSIPAGVKGFVRLSLAN